MSRYQLTEVKLRSVIKEELRKVLKETHTKDHTMESDNYSEAVSGLDPIMVDEISEEDITRYLEVMSLEELIQTVKESGEDSKAVLEDMLDRYSGAGMSEMGMEDEDGDPSMSF